MENINRCSFHATKKFQHEYFYNIHFSWRFWKPPVNTYTQTYIYNSLHKYVHAHLYIFIMIALWHNVLCTHEHCSSKVNQLYNLFISLFWFLLVFKTGTTCHQIMFKTISDGWLRVAVKLQDRARPRESTSWKRADSNG